jgi:hypothetical protein
MWVPCIDCLVLGSWLLLMADGSQACRLVQVAFVGGWLTDGTLSCDIGRSSSFLFFES